MKIVFSFDDGRSDAFSAYKILNKYNLKGSFHVVTGFIDGTFLNQEFGKERKPLSVEQLIEMKNNKMDISSHGDRHVMENQDYRKSIEKLNEWGVINYQCGFSVPHSAFSDDSLNEFLNNNLKTLTYIRVGRSPKCYTFFSKISYILYLLTHLQLFYNYFEKNNLITVTDKFRIISLVVKRKTRIKNLLNFIRKNEQKDYTLVIMFHSIVEKPIDDWEYNIDDFEKLCSYCSNNENIECLTLNEL